MRHFDKIRDPIALYDWSIIGLQINHAKNKQINYNWHFKVRDKDKFMHAIIKFNLL